MSNASDILKRPAGGRKTLRRFVPDVALSHHKAASLVPWQYRHAWAATANRALRQGQPAWVAVMRANEDLNGRLDRDADILAGASPSEQRRTITRALAENRRDVLLNAPRMQATAERLRRGDFATGKVDLTRHSQLLLEAARQRRASGQSH
jgi:hypothetical protein